MSIQEAIIAIWNAADLAIVCLWILAFSACYVLVRMSHEESQRRKGR